MSVSHGLLQGQLWNLQRTLMMNSYSYSAICLQEALISSRFMQIALLDVLMNSWHVSNTNLLLYIHSFYSEQNKFFSCQILTSCSLNQKRTNNIFHHRSLFLNLLPSPKTFLDFPSTSMIIESNTSRDGASTTPLDSLF